MKKILQIIAIPSMLILLVACQSCQSADDPLTPGDDNLGAKHAVNSQIAFTATVDGTAWEATEVTAVQSDGTGGGGGNGVFDVRQFIVKGETEDGDLIQITLQRNSDEAFGVGTYDVANIPAGLTDYTVILLATIDGESFQTFPTISSGTIEITKVSGTVLEGRFDAKIHQGASGPELVITDGSFKSDKYGTFY